MQIFYTDRNGIRVSDWYVCIYILVDDNNIMIISKARLF